MKKFLAVVCLACATSLTQGALSLSGTSYTQNFDSIGSGLPTEWSVDTGATLSSLGTAATFTSTSPTTLWTETSAGFYNIASADGLSSSSIDTQQRNSTDRAIGVKQAATTGYDPGAAIVLQIQNTTGLGNFSLGLEAQTLNEQTRSTTWLFQYRVGDSGNFTTLSSYGDPGSWSSTSISFNSSDLSAWNDQSSDIWFRVVALDTSTGSGSRDMFAIDDFTLSYSAVPEPAEWGLISGLGLLGICGVRTWREQRAARRATLA